MPCFTIFEGLKKIYLSGYKTALVLALFGAVVFVLLTSSYRPAATAFHTKAEMDAFAGERARLDSGEYFLGSIRCQGCHGYDTLHHSNIDADSNDINLYNDWQSTMMANSSKDPFWRAKVSHEILVDPGHSDALQTKCTSCHAPMGHFTATFKGAQHYTLADLLQDTLGLNGVACGGCHEIANDSLGLAYSGNIHYDTSRVEFGPFENPLVGPMQLYVGLIPTHSLHMSRSQVCASCHTLQTQAVDLNGNLTGTSFVEQATFHEWLNSSFNSDQPCQSCHMPQVQDPVIIANNILNLPPRSPFNLHKFMGGNTTMLKMMKNNKVSLGIDVPDDDFDSTITATMDLLRHSTLDMLTQIDSATNDTLFISVALTNKAGHKFPSGYPSRRAFVQLAVTNATNDTVFQSGMMRPDFEVTGQTAQVEPHYDIISDSSQVQIYEMAMGDVNSNFTTVLERAYTTLKDNRIPPSGFTKTHSAYDTIKIVGAANTDPDFNTDNGSEGTGKDIVHYHIPLRGKGGDLHISAAVYYQVLPPRWVTEMFAHSSDFIDSFKTMYQSADKTPVLIANSDADTTVIVSSIAKITSADDWRIFPIPSKGNITVQGSNRDALSKIEVWDAAGRKVSEISFREKLASYPLTLPAASGIYYLRIESYKGKVVRKVMKE